MYTFHIDPTFSNFKAIIWTMDAEIKRAWGNTPPSSVSGCVATPPISGGGHGVTGGNP